MQYLMVKFDDGTWLSDVTANYQIKQVTIWQAARLFNFDSASDLEYIINNVKAGTVYTVEVSDPAPTQLSTEGRQIGNARQSKDIRHLNLFERRG